MKTQGLYQYPERFDGRLVKGTYPYVMAADLTIPASTAAARAFDVGAFTNSVDKPFLVTRAKPAVVSLDNSGLDQADPNIASLLHLVFLQVTLLNNPLQMTTVPTRIIDLVDDETGFWEWDLPVVLRQRNGFQCYGTNNVPSGSAAGGVRIELAFHGVLLDLE